MGRINATEGDGHGATAQAVLEYQAAHLPAPPTASFRWVICALLFLATSINYMDRQVVSVLAPVLQGTFHWNEQEYGHIVFAFQLAYMIGLFGVGWFIDRFGLKLGYTLSIIVWSAAACATGLATTLTGFAGARFLLGLGEAGNFPAATKTIAEWFPRRERSLATGLFNTGTSSGAIIAPLLVPWIANSWGWQAAFVVLGASGFFWIILWLLFYQRPEKSQFLSPTAVSFIRADDAPEIAATAAQDEKPGSVPWFQLFGVRQTWGILISSAAGRAGDVVSGLLASQISELAISCQHFTSRLAAGGRVQHAACRKHSRRHARHRADFQGKIRAFRPQIFAGLVRIVRGSDRLRWFDPFDVAGDSGGRLCHGRHAGLVGKQLYRHF